MKAAATSCAGSADLRESHGPKLPQRHHLNRRGVLLGGAGLAAPLGARPARAALAQFPASSLHNRYWLAEDSLLTNPVWKTGMKNGLSEAGKAQVVRGCLPRLRQLGVCSEGSCWLWPSITQNAYQTAEVLAYGLGLGRSRIVPEYTFLDARGAGALDGLRFATAYGQLHAGDLLDPSWRPPSGYDGTPNESVLDVLARVRQLLSVTETQYSGEDVVIVSPDSENLSILQAAVVGADLRSHAAVYGFRPGEVRPLQLSATSWDPAPMRLACPHPPSCK